MKPQTDDPTSAQPPNIASLDQSSCTSADDLDRGAHADLELIEAIDSRLPQTQCARCGYDGCRPYATAIAAGRAEINQCPPGGTATIEGLAGLLHRQPMPLDPARGAEPAQAVVALIDEPLCIGCFKCVLVCPVDAIVGAPGLMHTVIAADCSGCELCLPVCPTDCISLPVRAATLPSPAAMAPRWRALHRARSTRLADDRLLLDQQRQQRRSAALQSQAANVDIAAAIARARARRSPPTSS